MARDFRISVTVIDEKRGVAPDVGYRWIETKSRPASAIILFTSHFLTADWRLYGHRALNAEVPDSDMVTAEIDLSCK